MTLAAFLISTVTYAETWIDSPESGEIPAAIKKSTVLLSSNVGESCSGVVTGNYTILTAGHCCEGLGPSFEIKFSDSSHIYAQNRKIFPKDDLCAVQVDIPQGFAPIRIVAPQARYEKNATMTIAGYGEGGAFLKWGITQALSHMDSALIQKEQLELDPSLSFDRQIGFGVTSWRLFDSRAAMACNGDSGGPVLRKTKNGYELIGIISQGSNCHSKWSAHFFAVDLRNFPVAKLNGEAYGWEL